MLIQFLFIHVLTRTHKTTIQNLINCTLQQINLFIHYHKTIRDVYKFSHCIKQSISLKLNQSFTHITSA